MKNKKRFLLFTTLPCLPIATGAAIGLTSCTNQAPKYDPECRYKTKDGKFKVEGNKIYEYLLNMPSDETLNNNRSIVHNELIPNEVELDIGKKVTIDTIGISAFFAYKNSKFKLDAIIIQDGIKYIENSAFWNNNLKNISLPDSIEKIGKRSFGNNKIESIKLSNNPKFVSIPESAFYDDYHNQNNIYIKNINSLSNVKYVGDYAFSGFDTDNLDFFTDSNLEFIGSWSFNFSPMSFEEIALPKTLKAMKRNSIILPDLLIRKINDILKNVDYNTQTKENEIQKIIKVENWEKIKIYKDAESNDEITNPDLPYVLDENQPENFIDWVCEVFKDIEKPIQK